MARHNKIKALNYKSLIYILVAIIALIFLTVFLVNKFKNSPNKATNSNNVSQSNSVSKNEQTNNNLENGTQKPQIYGVENGKIYYTTQYVYIEDDNIKSVTVNGEEYNTEFYIEGNADNMYVIEATDNDNNTTSFVIYSKTIKSLTDTINTLNKYTVTTDDIESIHSVRDAALNTGTKYSSSEESSELDAIITICENLLSKITEIQETINTITKNYEDPEYIESINNNIQKLASVISDIDALLASNNITSEQRTQLTSIRSKYNLWLTNVSAMEPHY